jgi:hypothetical protein
VNAFWWTLASLAGWGAAFGLCLVAWILAVRFHGGAR